MELISGVGLCTEKRIKKKRSQQQLPSSGHRSHAFQEKKKETKKRIKSDYSYYFLISTFPLDIMWILQCWLLSRSAGDEKQTAAGAGEGGRVKDEQSEGSK